MTAILRVLEDGMDLILWSHLQYLLLGALMRKIKCKLTIIFYMVWQVSSKFIFSFKMNFDFSFTVIALFLNFKTIKQVVTKLF